MLQSSPYNAPSKTEHCCCVHGGVLGHLLLLLEFEQCTEQQCSVFKVE
jgi:hypothetical protein